MDFATHLVEDLARKVFAGGSFPPAEGGAFDAGLWSTFRSTGLHQLLAGGSATDLRDAARMLRAAGHYAVGIPAAEALIANWLAARAGWDADAPLPTVVIAPADWAGVPWGRSATVVYLVHEGRIARCRGPLPVAREGANLAGEPRDAVAFPAAALEVSRAAMEDDELLCMAALCRAAMMAGAMERALDLAVSHAGERVQFGRPIGSFQAVQQMLAQLAAHAAAAGAAVDLAVARFSPLTAAVAKARASEAAGVVAEIAHQVVAAMGFTVEFPLHRSTRRLWAWRDEQGSELYWQRRLGAMAAGGAHGLWRLLCDPTEAPAEARS